MQYVILALAAIAAAAGITPGSVWVPATALVASQGSPSLAVGSILTSWRLDPNTDESITTTVAPIASWASFELDLYLVGVGPEQGNARIGAWWGNNPPTDGNSLSVPLEQAYTHVTVTSGGTSIVRIATNVLGTVLVSDTLPRPLGIRRNADDALDTLTSDYGVVGALLRGTA